MKENEIIENMTKSDIKLAPRSRAINIGNLKVPIKIPKQWWSWL